MMADRVILAIDAGGTTFKYNILDFCSLSELGAQRFYPISNSLSKDEMLEVFKRIFLDAMKRIGEMKSELSLVAFSVPGPFDCSRGVSLMTHKWLSLKDFDLVKEFRTMDVLPPTVGVSFVHDVHAFLLGEKMCGRALKAKNAAAVVIGTGVGFGMWDGNGFVTDSTGHPQYGIYKFQFKDGTLEDFVSGRGVSRIFMERSGLQRTGKEIEELAKAGDRNAVESYSEMGSCLGSVIGPILKEHYIEALAIGGRISLAFDFFKDSLRKAINIEENKLLIYPSDMLETAAMKGAASWGKRLYCK